MNERDIEMHEQNDPLAYASDRVDGVNSDEPGTPEIGTGDPPSPTNPEMPRDGIPEGT